ncbi:MAG: MNIO family bufferin maturase [Hyphomicrobium sp.]
MRASPAKSSIASGPQATRPPYLGFGLGLRPQHYAEILDGDPAVDWFEVISENYMVPGGQPLRMLDKIRARYPIVMHGVSLSIASTTPFNEDYLAGLKSLAERADPKFVSDHLCWTGVHGVNLHDLLPIPYTREALDHVVARVQYVQDYLQRPIALENVSTYVQFGHSEMPEWEFISEMTKRTGCWLVFDVNNVFVSAFNHDYDAQAFINGVPADRVVQFHLAGHEHNMTHIIDTHDALVPEGVWELYRAAVKRFGPVSTIIERDDHIPPLTDLVAELSVARAIAQEMLPELAVKAAS